MSDVGSLPVIRVLEGAGLPVRLIDPVMVRLERGDAIEEIVDWIIGELSSERLDVALVEQAAARRVRRPGLVAR